MIPCVSFYCKPPATVTFLIIRRERIRRRNRFREFVLRSIRDNDFLMRCERDRTRIARIRSTVQEYFERTTRSICAISADTIRSKAYAPDIKELTKRKSLYRRRLYVNNPSRIMHMDRRT